MNNDENKDFKLNETGLINGKRKVVLGQDEFTGEDQINRTPNSGEPPRKSAGGFFGKFLNQDSQMDPPHDMGQLTEEAKGVIREQNKGFNNAPLFDEEKDRLLAEESTKGVPSELLELKSEPYNPAARLVDEAQTAAFEAEQDGVDRIPRGPLTDKERRDRRVKTRWITVLVLGVIAALLIFLAPNLQEMMFKTTDDSLIFSPAAGLFGPRAGIIGILLGLLGGAIIFSTMFTKRKEEVLSKKQALVKKGNPFRTLGLAMLVLIPLGFAMLFNFTEFRNSDIRYSSLFNQNKLISYDNVNEQIIEARGNDIYYTIKAPTVQNTTFNITRLSVEEVRLLDNKLPLSRKVTWDSEVIQKLVEQNIYTDEEIIRLFINK